jgi:hypothetical protein
MNVTLITGNGFDLNFGLPTRYANFIQITENVINAKDYTVENIYKDVLNEELYDVLLKTKYKFDNKKIEKYKSEMGQNLWFKFFKYELDIETWIDFESKIESVLKVFENFFLNSTFYEGRSVVYHKNDNSFKNDVFEQLNVYDIGVFKNFDFISFSESISHSFPIDDRQGYTAYFHNSYLLKRKEIYTGISYDKIFMELSNELETFNSLFKDFFSLFIFPIFVGIPKFKTPNLTGRIKKHFTFNYTPTAEYFLPIDETKYLHGSIEKNNIVLGIDDINHFDHTLEKYLFPFTKYYQKLIKNTDYQFVDSKSKYYVSSDNHELFIFWGHSLDVSDKSYINEVFDCVSRNILEFNYNLNFRILIIYHDETAKSKMLLNLLSIRKRENIEMLMRKDKLIFMKNDLNEIKKYVDEFLSFASWLKPSVH